MTEIADRHRRLAVDFTERVEAVPDSRWESPSPCPGWTARDVVGHVVEAGQHCFTLIGQEPPGAPSVGEDPVASWQVTRDALQKALGNRRIARTKISDPAYQDESGPMTFEASVDQFYCFDLLVHTWDLARAAGLDERLDPIEVYWAFEQVKPLDATLRSSGAYGPKVEPPPADDQQSRFLAFLGRTA